MLEPELEIHTLLCIKSNHYLLVCSLYYLINVIYYLANVRHFLLKYLVYLLNEISMLIFIPISLG